METNRLNHYLQSVGGLAVIIGLALVVTELRQTASLTRAELASGTRDNINIVLAQVSSGDFSATYAKMLENPDDLTTAEMLEIDAFLYQIVGVFHREVSLKNRGIFEEDERVLVGLLPRIFANSYAQSWWSVNKSGWHPRVVELMEREIPKLDVNGNMRTMTHIRESL